MGNEVVEENILTKNYSVNDMDDILVQMVIELTFHNDYLRSHFEGLKHVQVGQETCSDETDSAEEVKSFHVQINSLNIELAEAKEAGKTMEEALHNLKAKYSETFAREHDISEKSSQAQKMMDEELKQRDMKYAELDSKFNRLLKRAKQRIQEVQKEKDDLELEFKELTESSKRISEQQFLLQQELEQTRQQANETLKAMDAERQQLQDANTMLRNDFEELRHTLGLKDNVLEALQKSNSEKEQIVAILESQLADTEADRNNMAETMRSLHNKEKETWEIASMELEAKLEAAEQNCSKIEMESRKLRSRHESAFSIHAQLLKTRDADLQSSNEKINHLETEFSSYKARANALLQKKDAELAAAGDPRKFKTLEEAFSDAERKMLVALTEKDKALHDLQDVMDINRKELVSRDAALFEMKQEIKFAEMKLSSNEALLSSEREKSSTNLHNLDEMWRLKFEGLKAEIEDSTKRDEHRELNKLSMRHKQLKKEHDDFFHITNEKIEVYEKKISKLLDENHELIVSLKSGPCGYFSDMKGAGVPLKVVHHEKDIGDNGTFLAEQQILFFARQQARREEELSRLQQHILTLQDVIEELKSENCLHTQQEAMLKEEFRKMERRQKREGVDMTYLKNVVLKLIETGEVEALMPVIGTLLQFTGEEMQRCRDAQNGEV